MRVGVDDDKSCLFSFAKYLMWKDLTDRADQLAQNRVVKHLLGNLPPTRDR